MPVTSAHDPFIIVQRPDGAYMLDTKTGVLTRVAASTMGVAASRRLPGTASALTVSTGGSATWVVDRASGAVQQVNPSTLAPARPQVPLGAPVGSTVTDRSGTLWAALVGQPTVIGVDPSTGAVSRHQVGQAGDDLQLVSTAGGVWAVDPQAGTLSPLNGSGAQGVAQIPQTAAGATAPVVASSTSSADVVVVSGGTVIEVDTATGAVSSVTDARVRGATQAVVANGQVYLLDGTSTQLDVLGLDPLTVLGQIPVPPGSNQLVAKDKLVFVNADGSPAAAVVDAGGQVMPITKYTPAVAAPGPELNGPPPASPANPVPSPASAPLPTPSAYQPGPAPSFAYPPTSGPSPAAGPSSAGPTTTAAATTTTGATTTTPVGRSTTTLPQPLGPPTIISVIGAAGSVTVRWQPSSGPTPSSYAIFVGPQGGQAAKSSVPATTTQTTVSGLSRGVTYCAQVQAVGAQPSTLSAPQCAATTPNPPGAPTGLSYQQLNHGVDLTFSPAPNATTYTIAVNGATVTTTASAGTTRIPIPASTPFTASKVTVTANPNAGGPGQSASLAVYSYAAFGIINCASNSTPGNVISVGNRPNPNCSAGAHQTIAATWAIDDNLQASPGYEALCTYNPVSANSSRYTLPAGAGAYQPNVTLNYPCPPAPAGFSGPGAASGGAWVQSGGTHTALVKEYQATLAGGFVSRPLVGPGQTPGQVIGVADSTLTNVSVLYSFYEDPA